MSKAASTLDSTIGIPRGSDLLETKLYARPARANLVARPRMIKLLDDGLSASLILVSAPAGFGKTTLLAEWLQIKDEVRRMNDETKPSDMLLLHPSSLILHPFKAAWLSLDAADNDPARFWAYVILALQGIHDELGETALAQLRSPQPPPVQLILPNLLNEIGSLHDPAILVLDDYHLISSAAVHSTLTDLLDNLPPNLHLVISTRSDPPLPIAKLRSRGQVVEIRADDLRFRSDEADAFLNQTMGLALSSEQVVALDERAEGWIAGLQMAALSMRGRDAERVDSFIRAFAGTNRFVMDFMLEEVLAREPEEVQHFLLQTSILTRLTGPLVDAVTGANGGREMLEQVEKRNLFVVPLDDDRTWYRYHHLFADLLQAQLQKSLGDTGVAAVHLRAAEWFEQNGLVYDAIHHASLASNSEWVERLIEQNYMEMINRGEFASIRFWTAKLSKELVYRRPRLCIYEAVTCAWFGKLDDAEVMLAEAEKQIRAEPPTPDTQAILGHHAHVKSRVTAMRGDIPQAIELCRSARENTPVSNVALQLSIGVTLGYEHFLDGDFANASQALNETIQSGSASRDINITVSARCVLARLYVIQGLLDQSYDAYQKTAGFIQRSEGQHRGAMSVVDVGMADVLREWNDLEGALSHLTRGLDLLPLWGKADDIALAYAALARIRLAQGNAMAAREAIEKGIQTIQTCGVFSEARAAVETAQVKLWLAQGDRSAADRWSASLEKGYRSGYPFRFEYELVRVTLARVYMAQQKLDEAIGLLSSLETSAESSGRTGRLIEILILKALAAHQLGEPAQALAILAKSLALAEPQRYVRVFVDEGSPMQSLLAQWLAHAGASPLRDYCHRLLSHFDAEPHITKSEQEKTPSTGGLVEPLSQRELEVLHLMALGRTNREIAQQLVVSLGTVKAHTANIYRKLDVANRTEAVARARQIGILP